MRGVVAGVLISLIALAALAAQGDLESAAIRGDLARVTALVNGGAPVDELNPKNSASITPLTGAIVEEHADVALFLLAHGADPKTRTPFGESLFHSAVNMADTRVLQAMLDRGAAVNVVDESSGETALFVPAGQGKSDVVDFLLAHGADPNIRDKQGLTAADRAHQTYLAGVRAKAMEDKLRAGMK